MPVRGAQQQITATVTAWEQVEVAPHRFGGVEYRLGRREIGHIHGDFQIDIPFPTRVRDALIAAGQAEKHHILPESGWITFRIHTPADVAHAIDLFRQSYDLARQQRARRNA